MLLQEINVCVDSGKGFTKFLTKDPQTHEYVKSLFHTRLQKIENIGFEVSRNSYLVEFKKESWLVGDMLSGNSINVDLTKKTLEHLICINLAICNAIRMTRKNVGIFSVNLAVNVPLSIFKNQSLKKQYEDFIRQEGKTIHLTVNGEHFLFIINNLVLIQEGLGSLFVRQNDFRDKRVIQVDIGTLNVTVSSFNQLVPQYDSNFSNNHGTHTLLSHLREKLSSHYGIAVHAKDMEQIIKDGILIIEGERMEDSTSIIQEAMMNHAKEIVASIKSHISLNNAEIVFVGGGSLLLREQLQTLLPHATFEPDPQFATLKSFHRILEAKLHHAKKA